MFFAAGGTETQCGRQKSKWAWVDSSDVTTAGPVGQTGGPRKVVLALLGMAEMQMQAEVESHWLIQTLSKVAFHSANGSSSLYSCSFLVALD